MNGQADRLVLGAAMYVWFCWVGLAGAQDIRFNLEIIEVPAGQEGAFPTDMTENGVIVGYAAADAFDPFARPMVAGRGQIGVLPSPTDSLNFALGVGRPGLIVGSSSNQPVAWVRGRPQILKPAGGLPEGFAYDANLTGVICGEVYASFTGRQLPVVWASANSTGYVLPALGEFRQGVAFAINERNQVAGALKGVGGLDFMAVRWDSPSQPPTPLGALEQAINSEVVSINDLGDAAGRSSFANGSVTAMLHVAASGENINVGTLGGNYSFANDVNNLAWVVGVSNLAEPGEAHGFLWVDGQLLDLNDAIESSSEIFDHVADATAIDDSGRICVRVLVPGERGPTSRMGLLEPVGQ